MGAFVGQYASLAAAVANSAAFRSVVGAASATDALAFIHYPSADESETAWPRAIITPTNRYNSSKAGVGTHKRRGSLLLTLEFEVPEEAGADTETEQLTWFATKVDAILSELEAVAGTGISGSASFLNIVEIDLLEGPWQEPMEEIEPPDVGGAVPETTRRPQWWAVFTITWQG